MSVLNSHIAGALAAAILALSAPSASAVVLYDFQFTFNSQDGIVVGLVNDLTEGANSVDTIEVTSHTAGFGVGTYTHNFGPGPSWTVSSGVITDYTFSSIGQNNTPPDVTDSSILMLSSFPLNGLPLAALTNSPNFTSNTVNEFVQFDLVNTTIVPLPASALLLLTGLAAVAGVRFRPSAAG